MNNRDHRIVLKILAYCTQVEETHRFFGNDQALFLNEQAGFVYRNSVAMPILQIGELSKQLSDGFRAEHSEIPWRAVAGMRDIFAHHYGSVDPYELWHTAHEDISATKTAMGDLAPSGSPTGSWG